MSYVTPLKTLDPDGCVTLSGTTTFMLEQGLDGAVIEWQLLDDLGRPIAVETPASELASEPSSEPAEPLSVTLRFREASTDTSNTRIYESTSGIETDANGIIRFTPPLEVVHQPGVYLISAAIMKDGKRTSIRPGIISVERSLFPDPVYTTDLRDGPPTLREVWLWLQDSTKKNLWLGQSEFAAEDIVDAIIDPVREYNEHPPELTHYTTKNFPWRRAWMRAVCGYLLERAANNYRRTTRKITGGGLAEDVRNKEREYMAAAERLIQEWKAFFRTQKIRASRDEFWGGLAGNGIGSSAW